MKLFCIGIILSALLSTGECKSQSSKLIRIQYIAEEVDKPYSVIYLYVKGAAGSIPSEWPTWKFEISDQEFQTIESSLKAVKIKPYGDVTPGYTEILLQKDHKKEYLIARERSSVSSLFDAMDLQLGTNSQHELIRRTFSDFMSRLGVKSGWKQETPQTDRRRRRAG